MKMGNHRDLHFGSHADCKLGFRIIATGLSRCINESCNSSVLRRLVARVRLDGVFVADFTSQMSERRATIVSQLASERCKNMPTSVQVGRRQQHSKCNLKPLQIVVIHRDWPALACGRAHGGETAQEQANELVQSIQRNRTNNKCVVLRWMPRRENEEERQDERAKGVSWPAVTLNLSVVDSAVFSQLSEIVSRLHSRGPRLGAGDRRPSRSILIFICGRELSQLLTLTTLAGQILNAFSPVSRDCNVLVIR